MTGVVQAVVAAAVRVAVRVAGMAEGMVDGTEAAEGASRAAVGAACRFRKSAGKPFEPRWKDHKVRSQRRTAQHQILQRWCLCKAEVLLVVVQQGAYQVVPATSRLCKSSCRPAGLAGLRIG